MSLIYPDRRYSMTDNELLAAISHIVQSELSGIKTEISDIKLEISELKSEISVIKSEVTKMQLHIENSTDKNIKLLAENFVELTKKLNQAIPVADKNLAYEVKVNYLIEDVNKLKEEIAKIKDKIA